MQRVLILLLTLISLNVIVYAGTEVVHYNCAGSATTIQRGSNKAVSIGSQEDKMQQEEIKKELQQRREARLKYWNKVQEQKLKQKQELQENNTEKGNEIENTETQQENNPTENKD